MHDKILESLGGYYLPGYSVLFQAKLRIPETLHPESFAFFRSLRINEFHELIIAFSRGGFGIFLAQIISP